ncbi:hypothetical protein [Sphingobacterium sp. UDSM-2020]|uniref:hypothetical protein n=1 Tax=Sphingobacterium sp. UDSM-2020 TaxID=2795738 RepID=UPI0019374C2E|nr:hypothetical protein [Sphingobacterium sp. UDSM-2020]QQD15226.1 hypothetical protein JAZ75_06820 [Sphingobacterium sp. UDSM-2020]
MTKINIDALRAKYLDDEPVQKIKAAINANNFFLENNPNGYADSNRFLNSLMQFPENITYKRGIEEFLEASSAGNYFQLSDAKQDDEGINFYWISYYKGRIRRNLKVPEFEGLLKLLETSRRSEISLTLEGLINKAIENIK